MSDGESPSPSSAGPSRFQFSLFRLLVVVTLAAILLGLVSIFGNLLGTVFAALVWYVMPTPLVIGAIYGRRDVQAFSIGALLPWVVLIVSQQWPLQAAMSGVGSAIAGFIWIVGLGGICGAVAVVSRRWLEGISID